ncbi:MAG: diguanylate cyclase [Glaciecola sp.]
MTKKVVTPTKLTTTLIVLTVAVFVLLLLAIPYHLTQMSEKNSTTLNATYFVDQTNKRIINDAIELNQNTWQQVDSANFGLSPYVHWVRMKLPANENNERRLLLVNYGLIDHVDVWFVRSKGDVAENSDEFNTLQNYQAGDAFPFHNRELNFEQFLFPVPQVNSDIWVYIRAESKGPIKVPVELWGEAEFIEHAGLHKIFMGLFFGFMIAMSLSNLFIYASSKNIIFAYYTGYVACIAMVVASLNAIGFHYIWPNNIWLQEFAVPIFASLTLMCIIALSIKLLDLHTTVPKIFTLLRSLQAVFGVVLISCFALPYEIVIKTVLILLVVSTPLILTSGIILAIKGSLAAKYFCGAWSVLLFSGVSIAMENLGVYSSPIDSVYLIMVGAIAESLLLALALSVNYSNQLQLAKKTRDTAVLSEQEALKAQDELIALQQKNQAELEYSIEERTLELEVALRELADKNRDLEKLSAIDPLTGLYNRRYFDKRLLAEARRSKRELTPLGLAMLDIDHFKQVNDTHGHLCGDHCLKVFADLLKEHVKRPSDVVCRYGGEEFVIILPNTDEQGVAKLLEKIRHALEHKKIMFEGNEIPLTVSIGATSRVMLSEDEHVLIIAFVDKQLYRAKNEGRNQVWVDSY